MTGVKIMLSDDWVRNEADIDVSAPEILIGETNRPQSRAVMAEIEDCTFDIRVEDNKLIICGANATMLSYALDYFEENILTDSRYLSADGFCLEKDFHYVSEKYPATIPNLIRSGVKYRADSKLYTTFVPQGNYKIVQGGGSDGTYFYMAMIDSNAAPGEGIIRKIDIKTKKVVKTSEVLTLGHCNDITYNEKTGQLVVSFCESPYYDRAYFVDPDTLTITGYQTLSEGFYAIAYSSERDQYVTARNGGQYMTIYDGNFKPIKTLTVKPTGYTTQGIECDENYIYCVQYVKNVLLVYDWDGNLLTETILRFGQEPENVMIVDGQMYVGCNNSSWSGGEIVTVDLVPIG